MSFDYFSIRRMTYFLEKIKDIFDTKADISDVPENLSDLSDVTISSPANGQVPVYNSSTGVWENGNIPSANDGTLTIQKNGVDVQTFTANQSTNVTANITVPTTAADVGAIPTTQKGVASGVAELDSNGKVPSSQLPSYVDDTIEGYLYEGHWYSDAQHTQEVVGETGKIYVELSTNKTYRWSGTTFVEISEGLALGETSSTAYRGDRGATAYSHATDANKVSSATATGLYKVGATAEGHISELQAVQKSDITNLGIPGAVKLTITVSESEDPQTGDEVLVADKTPSEVLAALNGGVVVEAVYEGRVCSIAQNLLSSDGRILFGVTVGGDNVGLFFNGLMFIKDSQDDAWESITLMNSHATQRLNASIDYSNNTYSCDYTYDEFESARSNGQEILVEYDNVIYYFTKYDSSEYTYYFSSTLADSDGTAINTFVMVGDDSTGDWDSITLTESSGGSASSFLVRVYEDPQTQQTTCDKLPSEILAAYTNGSIIQAKIELEGEDAMLDLASCLLSSSPYLVIFSTLVTRQNDDTVTLSLHLQKDSSSDTWEDIDIYQSDLCHYVGNISHDTNGYYFDITPSKFDDAISYSLGARIKYEDSDNDVTYDFYLSRYDTSDSEHTVFYLTSVNADSTGETTILTFALYPDWELDYWDNIVLYETNGTGDVIWTGTQAEYNAQASGIPNGTTVHITDDEEVISQIAIVDNLTTQDATKALSANQGYVLKQYLDNKADIFTITLTWTQDPQTGELTFTSDKLPSEVIAAKNSGSLIRLTTTDTIDFYFNLIADSTTEESTAFIFSNFNTPSADYQVSYTGFTLIKAENSDTWASIEMISSEAKDTLTIEMEESSGVYSCDTDFDTLDDAYWHSINMFIDFNKEIFRLAKYDSLEDTFYFTNTMSDSSEIKTRTFVMVGDSSENEWTSITLTESSGSGGGASPSHMYIISSAGSEIEVETPSGETITPTQTTGSTTQWECDTTEFGEHTITVTLSNVDYTHDVIIESVEVVKVIYNATNDDWIDIRTSSGKPELTMAQYNYLVENDLVEPDVDYHIKDTSPVSAKSLDDLMDVEITSPSNDQSLVYDNVSEKWENKVPAYVGVWTAAVSGSVGDTTITFTNSNITTTSILDLYCENESGTPIVQTNVSISAGEAEYTIPALEEATDFKLWIRNL